MSKTISTRNCPVCHMPGINEERTSIYCGVVHHFCSDQCRDRFKTHPHLYVGDPKHGLSVKQKGKVVTKKHKLRLSGEISDDIRSRLMDNLNAVMGVESVAFEGVNILVSYDLLQVSLEDIENVIVKSAYELDGAITEQIKRKFIHYSEECELDNLAHLTGDGKRH